MRRVTVLLSAGEMLGRDIRKAMRISDSGCRKYLNALMAGAIIQLTGREPTKFGDLGQPIYKLVANPAQIDRFLDQQAAVEPKKPSRRAFAIPGRLIHLLSDDAPFPVRGGEDAVARDPFALPVGFFRSVEVTA
jgi:hypothetical protein